MIQVLIQSLLFLFVITQWGISITSWCNISFKNPVKTIFTGLLTVVIAAQVWHFFAPLNQWFLLFALLTGLLLSFIQGKRQVAFFKSLARIRNKYFLIVAALSLLYFSSLSSMSFDEALYHAGFIRWLNGYSIIKGLANVHTRYGFNSSWHLLSAAFNGYGIWNTPANCINCPLLMLFVVYCLWEVNNHPLYNGIIIFAFFPLLMIYHFIDPSADFVIFLFSFLFIAEIVLLIRREIKAEPLFWFLVFPFLLTIKMSAVVVIPLFLFYVFLVIREDRGLVKRTYKQVLLFSLVTVLPWVVSNVFISGYIIYPYVELSWISPVWKISHDRKVQEILFNAVTPVVRWSGRSFEEVATLSRLQQLLLWFKSVRIVEKLVVVGFLACGVMAVVVNRKSMLKCLFACIALGTLVIQIFLVPDIRFMAGIGFGVIVLLITSFPSLSALLQRAIIVQSLVIMQLLITVVLYKHVFYKVLPASAQLRLFSPVCKMPYPVEGFTETTVDGHRFYIPLNQQFCWDALPCIPGANPSLRLMGKDFSEGFYEAVAGGN